MVLGLPLAAFTTFHVLLSLVAILAGLLAVNELILGRLSRRVHGLFLATTIATSVTGFLFPTKFGPAHVIGILSLLVLVAALCALYVRGLAGVWRRVYVVAAISALYFTVFVAVIQSFQKVPFLHALAPTQEPPFAVVQGMVLVAFVVAAVFAYRHARSTTGVQGSRTAAIAASN